MLFCVLIKKSFSHSRSNTFSPALSSRNYIDCLNFFMCNYYKTLVKNLPSMRHTWVWSLGFEDPLEKGKATHSSVLAWRIPWTMQSMGSQRVRHNWASFTFIYTIKLWLVFFNPQKASIWSWLENLYDDPFITFPGCIFPFFFSTRRHLASRSPYHFS